MPRIGPLFAVRPHGVRGWLPTNEFLPRDCAEALKASGNHPIILGRGGRAGGAAPHVHSRIHTELHSRYPLNL